MTKKLTQIQKLMLPTLKKYRVGRSYIFGSTSRGEAGQSSDIDLLVTMPNDASLFTLISLQQDLEAGLKRRVDVVTPGALNKRLKRAIKPDLMRIL